MDLRALTNRKQLEKAKALAMRGLLNYQPFRLADEFYCGAGLSVLQGYKKVPPTVFCPSISKRLSAYAAEALAEPEEEAAFVEANDRLARCYDNMVEQITSHLGGLKGNSILDVGCNAGYFPLAFLRAGATSVCGYDRVDYSETFALLNDICRTRAVFKQWGYDGTVEAEEQFDLVTSVAMLVHLSDPLQHLAWLGASAKRALFAFTPVHQDNPDDLSIRFHAVNRYYTGDRFPYCFDVTTVSRELFRLAFGLMGFNEIHEITTEPMPDGWSKQHLGLLGIRRRDKDDTGPKRTPISGNSVLRQ